MPKYNKFTPINKIVPQGYMDRLSEPPAVEKTVEKLVNVEEDILDNLPDDEDEGTDMQSFYVKMKKYIITIVIITILLLVINNKTVVTLMHGLIGKFGFTKIGMSGDVQSTTLGIVAQGTIMGALFIIISKLLSV